MAKIRDLLGAGVRRGNATTTRRGSSPDLVDNDTFVEFLTLPAYELID